MENHPEVHSLKARVFVTVWAILIAFTALTVGLSSVPTGRFNVPIALAIAAAKSSLVVAYFMHLRYEKVRLYLMLVVVGLLTVTIMIVLTFADLVFRY